ncbi:hypothetical protein PENARI_c002G07981 [Penicillium arizonense]|uniref:ER-bound oxygenase mpaB/mpaB'/Rubber oxygenase catalytic domain-containing protein n=1 Tax=Penicillium arizonense TaxID=1835702 RepID=A0A1F5LUB7_PENAI|nr:hypothetical protein PENARI_c002G07981 [Penicillium arizonense]OGE56794.1 hypothetical protein PENARI_c002G07981 [Penicillium arizonense]
MTNDHAYEIQRDIFQLEFPYTAAKALGYALFRTYGIPSISKLLAQTRQLSDPANAGKRSADTGVLILEFLTSPPSSERANAAIARMNWQHSNYQKAGKISNDDLLYTLSLFALEPRKWIQRYEWRSLNEMEQCAFGVFWKSIGDAMKISYDGLPSARIGWKDGIHWLHEVEVWAEAYEKINMVPDLMNHKTANETTALFLYGLPTFMHKVGKQFVTAIMDDRLREAIMYPRSPWYSVAIVQAAFACRKLFLCYIALPRFTRLRTLSEDKDSKTGRYHMEVYNSEPW